MTELSRRSLLGRIAMAGTVLGSSSGVTSTLAEAPSAQGGLRPKSAAERQLAARPLLEYFKEVAPQLLRPRQEPFKYPSIAPSLPGKVYSAELWDWDTLWTTRGLFAFAKLSGDQSFRNQVTEHAIGSLLNFFDHQSPEGRLPIVMSATSPSFGQVSNMAPNYRNQAKPVMGQLAMLIADETGRVDWLAPVFDRLMSFHASWILGNQTATGLLVWGDDVAIGNDNDPTTFGRPFFSRQTSC